MGANLTPFRGKSLLVDTNVIINQLNGKLDLAEELAAAKKLYISALTVAELYAGAERSSLMELKDFLTSFISLPVTEEIAVLAGAYKNALTNYALKDLIIAATAEVHHLHVVTANKKDFFGINTVKSIYI